MGLPEVFALTARPGPEVFHRRGDVNDPRLGESVAKDPSAYPAAQVVILGCPQDEGVRRNRGRPGAAQAPAEIRRCLYRMATAGLSRLALFDIGDTLAGDTLEETHAGHEEAAHRILADGKRLIVLGGGNDIAYPDCRALARVFPQPLTFNIDAHLDVRSDAVRNSGTPYRQLLEEGLIAPRRFFEIGAQPFCNSEVYADYLRGIGVRVITLEEAQRRGAGTVAGEILRESDAKAVFWGFDMDAVRSADAPGVSAPSPIGFSAEEFCLLAALAGGDARSRVLEFTEVNPAFDSDGRTSRLAAAAVWSALAAMAGEGTL